MFSLSSNMAMAQGINLNYHVFDKVLYGRLSCYPEGLPAMNVSCPSRYVDISGWVREALEDVPAEISEVTVFTKIVGEFFVNRESTLEGEYGLNECRRAINLVKSNPAKWDLRLGFLESTPDAIVYCEAFNQSLMQQYYAEQE